MLMALFLLSPAFQAQDIHHWESILSPGKFCRYLVPSSPVDPGWTDPAFDDSAWTLATGGVGYGDEDDNTLISPSISVYCRYDFNLTSKDLIADLILDMDFDDGFVAYLNGTELARFNMGAEGSATTWDQSSDDFHEASLYRDGSQIVLFLMQACWTSLLPGTIPLLWKYIMNRSAPPTLVPIYTCMPESPAREAISGRLLHGFFPLYLSTAPCFH